MSTFHRVCEPREDLLFLCHLDPIGINVIDRSHAAINSPRVAKPCVTGCESLRIDKEGEVQRVNSFELGSDDTISIDGYTGGVFLGAVEIIEPEEPQAVSDIDTRDLDRCLNTCIEWKRELTGQA